MIKKIYLLSDLKQVPNFLKKKFAGLSMEHRVCYSNDDAKIYTAAVSEKMKLETIIVIIDMLKDKDRLDKKYVRWVKTERCSLIQEKVNRYFSNHHDLCHETAEKITKEKKIKIIQDYDLLAKRLRDRFLNEYRRRMRKPQNWDRKKKELTRDRFYYRIERIYDMPYPWKQWDYRNSVVQTYFLTQNGQLTFVSGGGGSSGQRENHSRYGFLFARCQNKGIDIPTHIMVYNNHNKFKYLTSSKSLLLSSLDLGSNYHIDWKKREKILKNILLLRVNFGYFTKHKQIKIEIGKDGY